MLLMPIRRDDLEDAIARADPRTWGIRRKMPYASPQESDCIIVPVTPAIREQLTGLDRFATCICITQGGRFEWILDQTTEIETTKAL